MPLAHEDVTPQDITGDPTPTRPLTQKQMAGAQSATVNRTRLGPKGPVGSAGLAGGNGQTEHKPEEGAAKPDQKPESGVSPDTPILGGMQQAFEAYQAEADKLLGVNPAHGRDWWQHALEQPVETYFMGKHLYNAYYNAFLDPQAIQQSVHDIWHQDSAVGWLLRTSSEQSPGTQLGAAAFGTTPEGFTEEAAGMGLPAGADPSNIAYGGMTTIRGVKLVASMLGPSAVSAIFADRHSPSDLAWAILPAVLLGVKLPPAVSAQVEKVAPGVSKVL